MNLSVKFSLVFVVVFGVGCAVTAMLVYGYLQRAARDQVTEQAQLMMQSAMAMRQYTSRQITPVRTRTRGRDVFRAQWVPAYAATQIFGYLHAQYPAYSYREPALNPTNPRDRATDWESDIINAFRDDPSRANLTIERRAVTGTSLVLARPIRAKAECMECHSTPAVAPAAMVRAYGGTNGFGWHRDEIIGAQVLSVPADFATRRANEAFRHLIISFLGVAVALLVALNLVLIVTVTRPVNRIAVMADDLSKGDLDGPEFPARGRDEISLLGNAFNRMRRSLAKALKMIE